MTRDEFKNLKSGDMISNIRVGNDRVYVNQITFKFLEIGYDWQRDGAIRLFRGNCLQSMEMGFKESDIVESKSVYEDWAIAGTEKRVAGELAARCKAKIVEDYETAATLAQLRLEGAKLMNLKIDIE